MKIYQLAKGVCKQYRTTVKGNADAPSELISRKLTRNIALARKKKLDELNELYIYGNLHIHVSGNVITKIKNGQELTFKFEKNMERYEKLNKILGIDEYEMKLKKQTNTELPKSRNVKQQNNLRTKDEVVVAINYTLPENLTLNDVQFICIGSDRSTGDCLGPLVGTQLQSLGYENVFGSLKHPVHCENVYEYVEKIHPKKEVIAIGSCLGQFTSIGSITVSNMPFSVGAGVGRTDMPKVGQYSINGCVNVGGFMEYMVLQNTRLSLVKELADMIVEGIIKRFPLNSQIAV